MLGRRELAYIDGYSGDASGQVIANLFAAAPAAIILTDSVTGPAALLRAVPSVVDARVHVAVDDAKAIGGEAARPVSASVVVAMRISPQGGVSDPVIEEATDPETHYVFGRLEQTTVALTTRVNYTMSPTLSLQIYAEPFVSAGAYSSFKELVDGRADRYADRYAPYAYDGNPDFNYKSFRTTNVLRWEYRPGSTLFVVWQQNREDVGEYGEFRFGRDFGDVFGAPARNVFLVKMAYWLNY